MPSPRSPVATIARKDISDALRDRFIIIVTVFLAVAALTALITGAIALATDVATYAHSRDTLLALGKKAADLKAPEFYPLKLLRGAIEQIEIIGAIIAILVGYRAAASERGRQTLALILTRPVRRWQFLAGKVLAGIALLAIGLAAVLATCAIALRLTSGVGLTIDDMHRILLVWGMATIYAGCFFLLSFTLSLQMRNLPNALLTALIVWLLLVLIAPQIGDTLDPDNQVAGGVFKQLSIAKPDQIEILKSFANYETVRTGIEASSITKHFERFSFAVLGIKDSYTGMALTPILAEKTTEMRWIFGTFLALFALLFALPIDPNKLSKE